MQQHSELRDPHTKRSLMTTTEPKAKPSRGKPGILVVDDDHMLRIMVQFGLERSGFEVLLASRGQEAIDLYREHHQKIDVVLLDIRMPGMDGIQTMEFLRDLNPAVLVCLMTGDPRAYETSRLLPRKPSHVIAKPFRPDELTSILRQLVDGIRFPNDEMQR